MRVSEQFLVPHFSNAWPYVANPGPSWPSFSDQEVTSPSSPSSPSHTGNGTIRGLGVFGIRIWSWPCGHGSWRGSAAGDQPLGHPNSRRLAVSIAASYVRSAKGMNCFQPLVCFKAAFNECFPTLEDTWECTWLINFCGIAVPLGKRHVSPLSKASRQDVINLGESTCDSSTNRFTFCAKTDPSDPSIPGACRKNRAMHRSVPLKSSWKLSIGSCKTFSKSFRRPSWKVATVILENMLQALILSEFVTSYWSQYIPILNVVLVQLDSTIINHLSVSSLWVYTKFPAIPPFPATSSLPFHGILQHLADIPAAPEVFYVEPLGGAQVLQQLIVAAAKGATPKDLSPGLVVATQAVLRQLQQGTQKATLTRTQSDSLTC